MSQESIIELELDGFKLKASTPSIYQNRELILADVLLIPQSDLQKLLARIAFASPVIAKTCHELANLQRTAIEKDKKRLEQEKRHRQVIANPFIEINLRFKDLFMENKSPSIRSIQLVVQGIMDDITSSMFSPPSNSFQQLHDIEDHLARISKIHKFNVRDCQLVPCMVRAMERLKDLDWRGYNYLKKVLPSRYLENDWFPLIEEEEYLRIWNGFLVFSNSPENDWNPLNHPAPTYINSYHKITQHSNTLLLSLPSEILRLIFSFASDSTFAPRNSTSNDKRTLNQARSKLLNNLSLTHSRWTDEAQKEHLAFAFINSEKSFEKLANHISKKKLTTSLRRLSLTSFTFTPKLLARLSKLVKNCINLYHFELDGNFDARLLGYFSASNITSAQFSNFTNPVLLDNWSHSRIQTLSLQHLSLRELPSFASLPLLQNLIINGGNYATSAPEHIDAICKSITNLSIDDSIFSHSLTLRGKFLHLETLTLYLNCKNQHGIHLLLTTVSNHLKRFNLLKSYTVKVGYQYLADKVPKERDEEDMWGYDEDGYEYERSDYDSESDGEEEADPRQDTSFSIAVMVQTELKALVERTKGKEFNFICTVEDIRNWMMT